MSTRSTKPTFRKFRGQGAKKYRKLAEKFLGLLLERMGRDGRQQARWRRRLEDGTVIEVSCSYDNLIISVDTTANRADEQCTLFLETGRQNLGSIAPESPSIVDAAQLEFSSDMSGLGYLGFYNGKFFKAPTTPQTKNCDGLLVVWNPWGLSSGTLTEGESLIVAIPVCERG